MTTATQHAIQTARSRNKDEEGMDDAMPSCGTG
jgi:hypothetical protein